MTRIDACSANNITSNYLGSTHIPTLKFGALQKPSLNEDAFEKSEKNDNTKLSKEDKAEIIHKSKKSAAGWSIFGGVLSTLYYHFRSDKTVAKKYNLDETQDKEFIKEIKDKQTIATIPGVFALGLFAWLYYKFMAK